MNLRNIPVEYHKQLITLDSELQRDGFEVRPKFKNGELTIVIYKRFLGIPIRIDISAQIGDVLMRFGMKIKQILRIGAGKTLPCYVLDNVELPASNSVEHENTEGEDTENRKPKKRR